MDENKKNEVIEEVETVEEIPETKEGFLTKAKSFVKRNGKKIAIGAISIVGLGLAYGMGKKSSEETEDSYEEDANSDPVDIVFTEVENE